MLLVIVSVICISVTVGVAVFLGTLKGTILDFGSLNFSNVITALIIGGFISCVIVGIISLFAAKSMFTMVRDYLSEKNESEEKRK